MDGTSFYFVLLDQSLRAPKDPTDTAAGVGGELWEVHGGGFYHVQKYVVAPRVLPEHLAWFKWEAYTTWLSGFGLMLVLYYLEASSALVKPGDDLDPWLAVAISIGLLAVAWIAYDVINRLVSDPRVLWPVLFALVALAAWASRALQPAGGLAPGRGDDRDGMAANVFFDIIPAQRELVRAKEAGREPDPAPGIQAKQRSVQNNYLTLPVLLTMLAGHFPFAYGADHAWFVLIVPDGDRRVGEALLQPAPHRTDALVDAGRRRPRVRRARGLGRAGRRARCGTDDARNVALGRQVFASAGCAACHTLADAGATGTVGPDLDAAKPSAALVRDRVTNGLGVMPSFAGKLSTEQIDAVAAYVSSTAGK